MLGKRAQCRFPAGAMPHRTGPEPERIHNSLIRYAPQTLKACIIDGKQREKGTEPMSAFEIARLMHKAGCTVKQIQAVTGLSPKLIKGAI